MNTRLQVSCCLIMMSQAQVRQADPTNPQKIILSKKQAQNLFSKLVAHLPDDYSLARGVSFTK